MKCYNHNGIDAIGICKSCGKGLCQECVVEIEGSLSCKNKCEETVRNLAILLKRNMKLVGTSEKISKISGKFYITTGIISVFIGLFVIGLHQIFSDFSGIFLVLGIIFVVLGFFAFSAGFAILKESKK